MQIKELLNYLKIASNDERIIKSVVTSTKDVEENCVLILTKGHTIDPNLLLNKDIIKKCLVILSDQKNENVIFIENLKDREKNIMEMRFGFKTGKEKTQKEVADMLGISQSYISRLEKKIISKMRKEILSKTG